MDPTIEVPMVRLIAVCGSHRVTAGIDRLAEHRIQVLLLRVNDLRFRAETSEARNHIAP
jgi:hypothetical protein